MNAHNARLRPNLDVGGLCDLLDEVMRHGAGERVAADQHDHFFGELGEMHGGLTSRVRAADDIHRFAFTGNGFGCSAAVVNASALKAINPGHVQGAPLNAHGQKKHMAGDFRAVG